MQIHRGPESESHTGEDPARRKRVVVGWLRAAASSRNDAWPGTRFQLARGIVWTGTRGVGRERSQNVAVGAQTERKEVSDDEYAKFGREIALTVFF